MFWGIEPEFQCFQWKEEIKNSHVCKNRARIPMRIKEGQNPKIRKDEVKIPMCIKIGPELECLEG